MAKEPLDDVVTFLYNNASITVKFSDFSRRSNFKEILSLPHSFSIQIDNFTNPQAIEALCHFISYGTFKVDKNYALDLFCLSYQFFIYKLFANMKEYIMKNIKIPQITFYITKRLANGLDISAFENFIPPFLKYFTETADFFQLPYDFILGVFRKSGKILTSLEYLNYTIQFYESSNYDNSTLQILEFTDMSTIPTAELQAFQKLLKMRSKPFPFYHLVKEILNHRIKNDEAASEDIQIYHLEARISSLSHTLFNSAQGEHTEAVLMLMVMHESGNLPFAKESQVLANYIKAAEYTGNPKIYFEIAKMYESGTGLPDGPNIRNAITFYEKASKGGWEQSTIILAHKVFNMYSAFFYNTHVNNDLQTNALKYITPAKVFEYVSDAAKIGDVYFIFCLGIFYNRGYYVKKNNLKAAYYFLTAKKKGHKKAHKYFKELSALTDQCTEKEALKVFMNCKSLIASTSKDGSTLNISADALEELKLAADVDHLPSLCLYSFAMIERRRYKDAKIYYSHLARLDNDEGSAGLAAVLCLRGKFKKAYSILLNGAQSGTSGLCLMKLAEFHRVGWGTAIDPKKEQEYIQRSAEYGCRKAIFEIAKKSKDITALELIAKNNSSNKARFEIGKILLYGLNDGKAQVTKGLSMIKEAADLGCIEASYFYGKLHADGEFVSKDFMISTKYLIKCPKEHIPSNNYLLYLNLQSLKISESFMMEAVRILTYHHSINNPSIRYKFSCLPNELSHLLFSFEEKRQNPNQSLNKSNKLDETKKRSLIELRQSADGESICGMFAFGQYLINEKKNYFEGMKYLLKSGLAGLDVALLFYSLYAMKFSELKEKGLKYLKYLAFKGFPKALTAYGIYFYDCGNFEKASQYLKLNAYSNNDREAEYFYGKMLARGEGMAAANRMLAINFFRLSDEKGYRPSQMMIVKLLIENEDKLQLRSYLKNNIANSSYVQYKYASLVFSNYFEKPQLTKDEAIDILKFSGLNGDSDGLWKFGTYLRDGEFVARDPKSAYKCFFKSAKMGNPNGKVCLGNMIISKNAKEAFRLFSEANDANNITGKFCYASCLKRGIGCEKKNQLQALKIFAQLARENNDKDAQYELFKLLINGVNISIENNENIEKQCNVRDEILAIRYLIQAANNGHTSAQWRLGEYIFLGKYKLKQDDKAAVHFYRLSAEGENSHGIWLYAKCLLDGRGVRKDIQLATKYLEKLCDKNDGEALSMYGTMLIEQNGKEKEGSELIRRSAEMGNASGLWKLGDLYLKGIYFTKDTDVAVKYFDLSAKMGNTIAIFKLAELHLARCEDLKARANDQQSWENEEKIGISLLKKAASLNQSDAQLMLADRLLFGHGIEKNENKAIELLKNVADNDHNADAMYKYGKIAGDERYLSMSAAQGHCECRIFYGKLLLSNLGHFPSITPNFSSSLNQKLLKNNFEDFVDSGKARAATYFFKLVADEGNAEAQLLFGRCLKDGIGVSRDKERAIEYFRRSALQGNNDARYEYGRYLYKIDRNEGHRYINEARENGCADAIFALGRIDDNLDMIKDAAKKGSFKAIVKCGSLFLEDQNFFTYLTKSAEFDGKSAFDYGMCLRNGFYTEKDLNAAFRYISKSYFFGYKKRASAALALHYLLGEGTDKDILKAFHLFTESVEFDDPFGINGLGFCHYLGIPTMNDSSEPTILNRRNALHFFRNAAEIGEMSAINNYGAILFENKDTYGASAYFERAALGGSKIALNNLKKISTIPDEKIHEIEDKQRNQSLNYDFLELTIVI